MDTNIYTPLWEKYRPAVISKMKAAVSGAQSYKMTKEEFEAIGERKKATYAFSLEIRNGMVINNSKGTAVARDLFRVLQESNFARELMRENYFKISLSKGCMLAIQTVKDQSQAEEAPAEETPTEETQLEETQPPVGGESEVAPD